MRLPDAVLQALLVGVCLPLLAGSTAAIWFGAVVRWCGGAVVRFLRARSPEREQLAWLACVVAAFLAASFYDPMNLVLPITACLIPVAIAVGVLRYGLLGIAAVMRRGLVCAVLTAAVDRWRIWPRSARFGR